MTNLSLLEAAHLVGTEVKVRFELLYVNCLIRDVKYVYGKTRFLISPIQGRGEQWIEESRISNLKF